MSKMSNTKKTTLAAGLLLSGLSSPIQAQDTAQDESSAQSTVPVVVYEFAATEVGAEPNLVAAMLNMAEEPQLSRLEVTDVSADTSGLEGALVFEGLESFSLWREDGMQSFFEQLGGVGSLDTTLRIFRPNLMAKGYLDGTGNALEEVSVNYRNSGNDSAGDADIDAVTVVCPGDHADCKPSN
ncbi:hypothetical protein JSE7799_02925 [Jannaschia seosinensis]|uniref:Uncharacterized protein n=1 Tax=Jannaschia seosinensis TaxID=313367 RepID=A0A0M7BFP1_9RHOB|nr:hypothetical protein [Jannaschia seosinensis]CUH40195.1 hypothetical protein JSE7799_02925 [Jannaschia seosinensis]